MMQQAWHKSGSQLHQHPMIDSSTAAREGFKAGAVGDAPEAHLQQPASRGEVGQQRRLQLAPHALIHHIHTARAQSR